MTASSDPLREVARLAADLGPALVPSGDRELLRSITIAAKALFDAAACSLAVLDEQTDELVFHVASGEGSSDVEGMRVPAGQGIAGWVVSSGQAIAIDDVARDRRFAGEVAESTGYVPRSILAMPLETDRAVIGVIEVLDRRSERDSDMELLALFARQAALSIENSRVFTDLGRTLFAALERISDGDLSAALGEIARDAPPPDANLADLAAQMNRLAGMGDEERRAATRLVGEFLDYLEARRRLR
ncbi:MAG: GAF domain-containing protein [Actinomycetota bacterium]|nr:GAF domain-containing protein [Actinomycetota bacterium]